MSQETDPFDEMFRGDLFFFFLNLCVRVCHASVKPMVMAILLNDKRQYRGIQKPSLPTCKIDDCSATPSSVITEILDVAPLKAKRDCMCPVPTRVRNCCCRTRTGVVNITSVG